MNTPITADNLPLPLRAMTTYHTFEGDGRFMVSPTIAPEDTYPMAVRRKMCRQLIDMFIASGYESQHSGSGNTVWIIVQHCMDTKLDWVVYTHRADDRIIGFTVKATPPPPTAEPDAKEKAPPARRRANSPADDADVRTPDGGA